ncbi:hypothetical protein [Cohnella lupini]|uniref:Uncharacterized protein n=1 Tax=Cohnella lupini TaxID=1294267 RepID=A0A3D9I1X5_9BACL|nr:hypothetical protein [Cohnella lupini]RED55767.1 hypothetical protein DFP95_11693 [Cohnella lupini]
MGKFQADTFSKEDMCITRVDDNKSLCYGDARSDIEKALGSGSQAQTNSINYKSGVTVFYRDNKVVGFALSEGSQDIYKTARGAQIGMTKEEVKSLYGQRFAYEPMEFNLDYAYDTMTGTLVEKEEVYSSKLQQLREQIFLTSVMFDGNNNGAASFIGLIDQKMALFLE